MDEFFDEEDETKKFTDVIFPFLLMGFQKGIDNAREFGTGPMPEDVFSAAVREAIRKNAFEKMSLVTDTTKGMLKDALQEAVNEGAGTRVLAKKIRDMYETMERYRSMTIARTELTNVINDGTYQSLKAEGHDQKEWSTVLDGHERDSHHAANGQIVPIDQPFKLAGGQAMFPGDSSLPPEEVCNCRCACVAPNLGEERRRTWTNTFVRGHGSLEAPLVVSLQSAFERQKHRVLSHFPS